MHIKYSCNVRAIIVKSFPPQFLFHTFKTTRKPSTVGHFSFLLYSGAILLSSLQRFTLFPHPVKDGQHHVEFLLLLFLGHVTRWVAQLGEEAAQVHEAQRVVLRAALVLPRPPHDPLHHVHLQRLLQAKAGPEGEEKQTNKNKNQIISHLLNKKNTTVFNRLK